MTLDGQSKQVGCDIHFSSIIDHGIQADTMK
jgi:hypothetical protein